MRGFGWIWVMEVDGCWLSFFVGDCLLQKNDFVVYLCVCSANRTMYVFLVKSVTK